MKKRSSPLAAGQRDCAIVAMNISPLWPDPILRTSHPPSIIVGWAEQGVSMDQPLDRFRSSTWGWLRGTLAGWGTLLLCLVGIGLVIILVKWIQNLATTYEVTAERLIVRRGIFIKSIDEIELYRVKDIRIDFTLVNQWADIGTITILSSDE